MAPKEPDPDRTTEAGAKSTTTRLNKELLLLLPKRPCSIYKWIKSIQHDYPTVPDWAPEYPDDDLDDVLYYSPLASQFPTAVTFAHALPRPSSWSSDVENEFDVITLDVNHPTLTCPALRNLPFSRVSSIVIVFDPGYDSIHPFTTRMVNMENADFYMQRLIKNALARGKILQYSVGSMVSCRQFAVRLVFKNC